MTYFLNWSLTPKDRQALEKLRGDDSFDKTMNVRREVIEALKQMTEINETFGLTLPEVSVALLDADKVAKAAQDYEFGLSELLKGKPVDENQIEEVGQICEQALELLTRENTMIAAAIVISAFSGIGGIVLRQAKLISEEGKRASVRIVKLNKTLLELKAKSSTSSLIKTGAKVAIDGGLLVLSYLYPELGCAGGLAISVFQWQEDNILGRSSALRGGVAWSSDSVTQYGVASGSANGARQVAEAIAKTRPWVTPGAAKVWGGVDKGASVVSLGFDVLDLVACGLARNDVASTEADIKYTLQTVQSIGAKLSVLAPTYQSWRGQIERASAANAAERRKIDLLRTNLDELIRSRAYPINQPIRWRLVK